MKALVIEDSQTGLAVVSQHLERMGIQPIAATDGESGVALFREHNPDIVLLDVALTPLSQPPRHGEHIKRSEIGEKFENCRKFE